MISIILATFKFASELIVPFLIAIALAIILSPLLTYLERKNCSPLTDKTERYIFKQTYLNSQGLILNQLFLRDDEKLKSLNCKSISGTEVPLTTLEFTESPQTSVKC